MTDRALTPPPRYSIVIPAHNEADLIGDVIDDLVQGMRRRSGGFELLVIENGSTDATAAIATARQSSVPELHVVSLPHADYGRAVATGFALATAAVIVHFDVDYYDLTFLDDAGRLIASGTAGIVLASKRAPGAADRRPLQRRLLTAGFTLAMRVILRTAITDAHGMKVLSREECSPAAERCRMSGALYDVELVLRASADGVRIIELPASVRELRPARTSVWRRGIESGIGLVRLRNLLRRERRLERRHGCRGGSRHAPATSSPRHRADESAC